MKYLCPEIEKLVSNLEKKEDVYIFNTPKNYEIYNLIWKKQREMNNQKDSDPSLQWGKNRIFLFNTLGGQPVDFQNEGVILDACSGLGRFSVAALEKKAKFVISYDGSFNGLQSTAERIKIRNAPDNYDEEGGDWIEKNHKPSDISHPRMYEPLIRLKDINNIEKRHVSIQGDIEHIADLFSEAKLQVDLVFHHMALQHTRDYKKTLSDFYQILKPGGCMVFNFFRENTTPKITYDMREIFLKFSPQLVYDFVEAVEKLEHRDLDSVLEAVSKEKYLPILQGLLHLSKEYSFEEVIKRLHFEDLQTPYQHNLHYDEVRNYVKNNLGMSLHWEVDFKGEDVGIICAGK